MPTTVALWVGLVAGALYIMEFAAVRIFKPLRRYLHARLVGWGALVSLVASIALIFSDGQGLKIGLAAVLAVVFS